MKYGDMHPTIYHGSLDHVLDLFPLTLTKEPRHKTVD